MKKMYGIMREGKLLRRLKSPDGSNSYDWTEKPPGAKYFDTEKAAKKYWEANKGYFHKLKTTGEVVTK